MEIRFLLSALRQRAWLIALLGLVGAVAGLLAGGRGEDSYTSTAGLLVRPQSSTFGGDQGATEEPGRVVATQLGILRSFSFAGAVAEGLPGTTAEEVEAAVEVSQRGETDFIDVEATGTTPQRARELAGAVANTFVAQRTAAASAQYQPLIDQFDRDLIDIQAQLAEVSGRIAESPTDVDSGLDLALQLSLSSRFEQILAARGQFEIQRLTQGTDVQLVDEARTPTEPEASSVPLRAALGGILGLGLGAAAALALTSVRPRVADKGTVRALLGRPVLSELPGARRLHRAPLLVLDQPDGTFASEVRKVCAFVKAVAPERSALTLLVTSTGRRAGRTSVALSMAAAYAEAGSSVVLVDADQQHPTLTRWFGSSARPGLTEAVAGWGSVDTLLVPSPSPRLRLLPAGSAGDGPAVSRASATALLEQLTLDVDVVVIDAGPILDPSATVVFSQLVDSMVLVVPVPGQQESDLTVVRSILDASMATVFPIVNHPSRRVPSTGTLFAPPAGEVPVRPPGVAPRTDAEREERPRRLV